MESCLYQGRVSHTRYDDISHRFEYGLFMALLDLDEVPELAACGIVAKSLFGLATFRESDHAESKGMSLQDEIRDLVKQQTGITPKGPIQLLTQLRFFGYYFSPLNLYYCRNEQSGAVEFIVAEVSNTPWREQHRYVLWDGNRQPNSSANEFAHQKDFHVSPFMDMQSEYRWRLTDPAESLAVTIQTTRTGKPFFTAAMSLERRPLTRGQLARMCLRYPIMTAQITSAIYWQALNLWWKKCPFYSHPKTQPSLSTPVT